jgi:hypothetical protein
MEHPMTAITLTTPDRELFRRLRPSREQLRVAAAMFRVATEDVTSVVVPVVAAGMDGAGLDDVRRAMAPRLEYPGGYWLADRGSRDGAYSFPVAREAAAAAARAHLRSHGDRGVPGWVTIRPDGTWMALDGA